MKTKERAEARRLRREEGKSLKEIARLVHVSLSSVSLWTRDIELTAQQHASLQERNPIYNAQKNGARVRSERARLRRRRYQLAGRRRIREFDPLYVAGCMLYWAEGGKGRHNVELSNSDPELVRLFVRFLRECFDVPDDQMRVYCHLFADHLPKQQEVEQFWLDTLALPPVSLRKSTVNRYSRSSQRKRYNRLPHGTCKLVVNKTEIVQTIYGSIQEFAGFNRPHWLVCNY